MLVIPITCWWNYACNSHRISKSCSSNAWTSDPIIFNHLLFYFICRIYGWILTSPAIYLNSIKFNVMIKYTRNFVQNWAVAKLERITDQCWCTIFKYKPLIITGFLLKWSVLEKILLIKWNTIYLFKLTKCIIFTHWFLNILNLEKDNTRKLIYLFLFIIYL